MGVLELVDVDGGGSASGQGITFGRYEEMLYCISLLGDGLSIIDTNLHVCSSQHHSCIINPVVCVSMNSLASNIVILHS